jgi:VWFA-related protein
MCEGLAPLRSWPIAESVLAAAPLDARRRTMTMSRTFARRIGLVALAAALSTGMLLAREQTILPAARELVRVYVTVTDQAGRLVTGLGRGAFEIQDDGSQPIVAFDNTPTPIRIIVLLDTSPSMEDTLPLLHNAANELFVRLRPDDRARVGYFGTRIVFAGPFTRDVTVLRAALPAREARSGATVLWRALVQSMQLFDAEAPERPVILVLSDGRNSDPFQTASVSVADVIDRAQRRGVMIYSVGVQGRPLNALSSALKGGGSSQGGFLSAGNASALTDLVN